MAIVQTIGVNQMMQLSGWQNLSITWNNECKRRLVSDAFDKIAFIWVKNESEYE